jgi:hypothetical protein
MKNRGQIPVSPNISENWDLTPILLVDSNIRGNWDLTPILCFTERRKDFVTPQ